MRTERFKGALLSTLLIASLLSPILLISPTAAWGQEIGWTRQFGTSDNDYAPGLAVDASGNVYIAGWTEGALPGQSYAGGGDVLLVKFVQITAPPTDFSIELAIAIAIGCAVIVAALYMRRRKTRK